MPRVLKKTRIKGLPPKVQLQTRDAVTGSFPAHPRLASDNRSGNFGTLYDDTKTIVFKSYLSGSTQGVSMPIGLYSTNPVLNRITQTGGVVSDEEMNTNFVISGIVRKGIGDSYVKFTPGQDFQPFRDDWSPAVDAKSVISGGVVNSFYATGSHISDVGEGFDQPLWSKSKIEIDLTPSASHSFFIQNYTSASNNYPMAYWNKDLKKWEGIAGGREFGRYDVGNLSKLQRLLEEQPIGFAEGMNNGGTGLRDFSVGAKISNFGFPYHAKFHGTSSNLIKMSDYIDQPFLLDKIVFEFSGTLSQNTTEYGALTRYTATTFFILNQRNPFNYTDPSLQSFVYRTSDNHTHTIVTGVTIPSSFNGGAQVNTIRDLVTYAQIIALSNAASTDPLTLARASRELVILSSSPLTTGNCTWSGRMQLSGVVKNALPNDCVSEMQYGNDIGVSSCMLLNKHSTRSGLFTPGGRDFVGALVKGEPLQKFDILQSGFPDSTDTTGSLIVLDKYSKPNPYLLMPTDQLIFGWNLPIPGKINGANPQYPGTGTQLSFDAKPAKIIFYGSQIREGREHHDTLNQLLTSVAVHEVVE